VPKVQGVDAESLRQKDREFANGLYFAVDCFFCGLPSGSPFFVYKMGKEE